MIHRIHDRDRPFVQIDKRPLENPNMGWKAKGLLAYFMSRPDNWTVRTNQLIGASRDGRESYRSAMQELKENGHVKLVTVRDDKGKIATKEWHVYEVPLGKHP